MRSDLKNIVMLVFFLFLFLMSLSQQRVIDPKAQLQ